MTLSGINVLLTRPAAQSAALASAITGLGGNVCELPLIEIEPVTEEGASETIKSMILNLDHYYAAIFISTNAARIGMQWIDRYWPQLPVGLSAYAVGPGTAQVLKEFDWNITKAAQALEINRVTLHKKIKKYELRPDRASN